jgi:hypothetical protein
MMEGDRVRLASIGPYVFMRGRAAWFLRSLAHLNTNAREESAAGTPSAFAITFRILSIT